MKNGAVESFKNLLGEIPYTAELYYLFRQKNKPLASRFSLINLQKNLPDLVMQAGEYADKAPTGKKVLFFATLHYWIEQATLLGLTLAGLGHDCHLAYLPYSDWQKQINRFDLRRQDIYARLTLEKALPYVRPVSLLGYKNNRELPAALLKEIETVSYYDAQYTLQVETVDLDSEIYRMRLERNRFAAEKLLALCDDLKPDVILVPNGTIQELGAAYRVAKHLGIPVSTYEFSDQKDRIWLAQNSEIMRQETDALWQARKDVALTTEQQETIQSLYKAKVQGDTWKNFVRHWQSSPRKGGSEVAKTLGIDDRPVILLATNVLGDSLTLGRQVFSKTMAEWIERSVAYFARRPDVQLVIRVHPGEVLTHGPSMVDVVQKALPELPENIHLVGPKDPVNTYDIIEMADLGLVYTTTTGMEMAMSGVPVIVAGVTHYKGNGFTIDPQTYEEYFARLDALLVHPQDFRLTQAQIDLAWHYAYCFFFEFSLPFPWRLVQMWDDLKERPISYVLGEGMGKYNRTFDYLTGTPIEW